MIRLFASDLDGTLLNPMHRMDPYIEKAIRTVVDRNRYFAIATGRSMVSPDDFGFDKVEAFAVSNNGALIFAPSGQILREKRLNPQVLERLVEEFPEVPFEFSTAKTQLTGLDCKSFIAGRRHSNPLLNYLVKHTISSRLDRWRFDVTPEEIISSPIIKINLHTHDQELSEHIDDFLAREASEVVNAPFMSQMYEITQVGVNKGEAVAWLAAYLGIREEQVAVFGDSGNDLLMLERFKHSYVPANGSDRAKRAATFTLASNWTYSVPRMMMTLSKDPA